MTRHEAHALVIAAVGDLPMVRRIDYVVDTGGEGVVVTMAEGRYFAMEREQSGWLETVAAYRALFLAVQENTARHVQFHANGGGYGQCRCEKPEDTSHDTAAPR